MTTRAPIDICAALGGCPGWQLTSPGLVAADCGGLAAVNLLLRGAHLPTADTE